MINQHRRWGHTLLGAMAGVAVSVGLAVAADTTEPFDAGTIDLEVYVRHAGIGLAPDDRETSGECVIGYGFAPRISAFLDLGHGQVSQLTVGRERRTAVLLVTALDTNHVDLDLLAAGGVQGEDREDTLYGLGFELNLDRKPDLAAWGAYLRGTGTHVERDVGPAREEYEAVLGAYVTMAPGHQLLAEYDSAFLPSPDSGERPTTVGGVALGYNVVVHPALELVTEVRGDIPQRGERGSASVLVGVIGTIAP